MEGGREGGFRSYQFLPTHSVTAAHTQTVTGFHKLKPHVEEGREGEREGKRKGGREGKGREGGWQDWTCATESQSDFPLQS